MKEILLLKYGELVLKGLNRYKFEDLLLQSVRNALSGFGKLYIKSAQSTVYVAFDGEVDMDDALDRVSRVFGLVSVVRAAVCDYDIDNVMKMAADYLRPEIQRAKSFRVIAKRADKSYPMTSPQIGVVVGEYIFEHFEGIKVDLDYAELTVYVEVREGKIFIHSNPKKGAGGLPCGSGGMGLLMLSGGLDSPVAGYMMARRGMKLCAVHFESPPYTSPRARQKVEKLTRLISRYSSKISLFVVPFTDIQEIIRRDCREDLFTIIMRRFMLRIACGIADRSHIGAIITGESLGQVASQTLDAIICTDEVSDRPVFRPLIGMDKQDIVDISYKIETYETSIEPYEDCCTVFTPKHPKLKPTLDEVKAEEAKLNVEDLVTAAVAAASREEFTF